MTVNSITHLNSYGCSGPHVYAHTKKERTEDLVLVILDLRKLDPGNCFKFQAFLGLCVTMRT